MLYVTDGGVMDCTALLQLMIRKRSRILLVLAAADPADDLAVLRTTMAEAQFKRIGSFYDPACPERSTDVLLESFKDKPDMPYLHIGICYSWGDEEPVLKGDLLVVKNRLPEAFREDLVAPLLTEEEINSGVSRGARKDYEPHWHDITTDKLGPFGCCDCCHTQHLNCGPKFPHGAFTGYLYLTPAWASSLMRLGHAASKEAVDAISFLQTGGAEASPSTVWI